LSGHSKFEVYSHLLDVDVSFTWDSEESFLELEISGHGSLNISGSKLNSIVSIDEVKLNR
jgi:hypothetical protein